MTSKKKLIIFIPSIEQGGVEKNLFLISNFLATKINNVKLITVNKEKKYFRKINIINPKSKIWVNANRYSKYFICLLILFKLFLKNRNYVVLAFQANLYCILICKLFGIKILVRSNTSSVGWSQNLIKKFFYKKILNIADQVIVNSNDFKKELKKSFSINAKCIYNPLNKNEIIKKSKEKLQLNFLKTSSIKIINIARFTDQKDHLTLLNAMKKIKSKIKFRLVIIGGGPNRNLIKKYILENNLKKNIKILNYQKNPFKFIKNSDIFILTSKFEGLPNVLLEAAVLKKFIISTNCPTGPREILSNGKGGELVKIGNFKSISEKIISYSKNKNKFVKKINYNFKSLNKFDYYNNLNAYLLLVQKYLKK